MKRLTLAVLTAMLAGPAAAHGEHDYDWMQEAPPPAPVTDAQCNEIERRNSEEDASDELQAQLQECQALRREQYEKEM